jgi:hypothetical protein
MCRFYIQFSLDKVLLISIDLFSCIVCHKDYTKHN